MSGYTKGQLLIKSRQRNQDLHRPMVSKIIRGVNPTDDTILLDGPEGMSEPIPVKHTFLNLDSWIRSMPSRNSGVRILQNQSEDHDLINDYYYPNRDLLVAKYREYESVYRPLFAGEHEISSSGIAQTFWSQQGRYESRGGIINQWLDNNDLESGAHSPFHTRRLQNYASNFIGDEERFGVVKRPISSIKTKYIKEDGAWCKEYLRHIIDGNNNPLIDHREGNVIDDNGIPLIGHFKNNLRFYKKVYTKDGNNVTSGIDENGNIYLTLPVDASKGGFIEIPSGDLKADIEGDLLIEAAGNSLKMTQGEIELKVGTYGPILKMNSKGVTINGHYLVYKEFLDYFGQTHLPSTGIGPAAYPVAHNPSTIVSFTVKDNLPGQFKSNSSTL